MKLILTILLAAGGTAIAATVLLAIANRPSVGSARAPKAKVTCPSNFVEAPFLDTPIPSASGRQPIYYMHHG